MHAVLKEEELRREGGSYEVRSCWKTNFCLPRVKEKGGKGKKWKENPAAKSVDPFTSRARVGRLTRPARPSVRPSAPSKRTLEESIRPPTSQIRQSVSRRDEGRPTSQGGPVVLVPFLCS